MPRTLFKWLRIGIDNFHEMFEKMNIYQFKITLKFTIK